MNKVYTLKMSNSLWIEPKNIKTEGFYKLNIENFTSLRPFNVHWFLLISKTLQIIRLMHESRLEYLHDLFCDAHLYLLIQQL